MAHDQDSNLPEVEECKRVIRRAHETDELFKKVYDYIGLGLETDEMLLNHLKDLSSSAEGEEFASMMILLENVTAQWTARLRMMQKILQIYHKSSEDYRKILEMNNLHDFIHLGNAYIASVEKCLDMCVPFARKVYRLYHKYSTEMKIFTQGDKVLTYQISAEISEYRSKLEVAHRDLPFASESLQAKIWGSAKARRIAYLLPDPKRFDVKTVPHESSTVTMGKEAKTIEIGGCKVSFPAGTFTGAQSATVTTEIDVEKWPPGREAITPTLFLNVKNLQKPATLALPSWCRLENDKVGIDLMQFNEDTKKWKVISPPVAERNEACLEFQSHQGGQFIGILRPGQYLTATYVVRPIICFKNPDFVVALIRDTELDRNKLMESMKNDFGDDFKTKHFCPLPCTMTQTIDSCIKCVNPCQGFEFVTRGSFSHDIQNIIKYSIPSYGLCKLESKASKTNVTLVFELREGDKPLRKADCFQYCWEPVVEEESKDELEEAFNDISSRFTDTRTFRVFAFSKRGFDITKTQLKMVIDDHTEDYEQKRAILRLWRKNKGKNATATKLRELVDEYFDGLPKLLNQAPTTGKERLEDVFTDISTRFASAQEFEKFAFAGSGLGLSFVEVDEIKSDNARELERRVAMIRLWSQREGERGTPTDLRNLVRQYFDNQ